MTKKDIIVDLQRRQRALSKQQEETSEDAEENGGDDAIDWNTEVEAKVELVDELLELYTKPKRRKR